MNDLDLEDIESHLYSQVYHSLAAEEQTNTCTDTTSLSKPMSRMKPGRYFGPWSPASKFQNRASPKQNSSECTYSKNYGKVYTPDISINQVVVVSPQSPIVCMTRKQQKLLLKKAKWRERLKERRKLKHEQKREEKRLRRAQRKAVITLSDSDDDSCVLIDTNWPVLSVVDSDEEKKVDENICKESKSNITLKNDSENVLNESLSDDVIFVEPVNSPIEVITLDEEPDKNNSTEIVNSPTKVQQVHQERKELLSTPDSASNDFMTNSGVELHHKNFNFSLHGLDFNNGEFVRPAARNETCETESSSSTTDANTVNLMKTAVFNEVDFPNFSENLESFGNFITPLRNNTNVPETHSTPVRAEAQVHTTNSSDSSSESDYEESQVTQKAKILPELSPMQQKDTSIPQVSKKSKKISLSDKDKQKSSKKKKKIKNKKSEDEDRKQQKRKSDEISENPCKKKIKAATKDVREEAENQEDKEEVDSGKQQRTELENNSSEIFNETASENIAPEISLENSALEGLIVVDEVTSLDRTVILPYESDSILSPLTDPHDIQLNCEDSKNGDAPSTSKSSLDLHNSSVKDIQHTMSSDPDLWIILDSDRMPSGRRQGRRCNRCKQFGHAGIRCPNRVEPKCRLCGEAGHYEPRCPNRICTQCGTRSLYSTTYCTFCFKFRNYRCQLCSMLGHPSNTCPDLWRRYHLTTTEGPLTTYEGPLLTQKSQLWCSGCAQSGHLEYTCRYYRSLYPPADPFIKSYEDIYASKDRSFDFVEPASNYRRYDEPRQYQNNYGRVSHEYRNPYVDGIFVANQQNFFPTGPQTLLQYPQNDYPGTHHDFTFENDLPNFMSFEAEVVPPHNFNEVPTNDYSGCKPNKATRRKNTMFFSSTALQLQHFLGEELQKLSKFSFMSNKHLKDLRKRQVPREIEKREAYWEKMNMVLFGVLNLMDGKAHLERLKRFKRERVRARIDYVTRRRLHKSYSYIFGCDKHDGVDYYELLRRI